MAIIPEFKEEVDNGDRLGTRIMLKNVMLDDPSFAMFDEMIQYAEEKIPDLYDEHNGEEFSYDKTQYTIDYMNTQFVAVVNNFSKERIALLRDVVQYIYADEIKKEQPVGAKQTSGSSTHKNGQNTLTKKQVGAGITAVGAVTALAGICLSEGRVVVAGGVIALAGIAVIITDN